MIKNARMLNLHLQENLAHQRLQVVFRSAGQFAESRLCSRMVGGLSPGWGGDGVRHAAATWPGLSRRGIAIRREAYGSPQGARSGHPLHPRNEARATHSDRALGCAENVTHTASRHGWDWKASFRSSAVAYGGGSHNSYTSNAPRARSPPA